MIGGAEHVNGHDAGEESGRAESYEVLHLDALPGILSYHAFCLGADGGIATKVTVEAQADFEAIRIVDTWPNAHGIDLWERGRLIASFPPRPDGSAASGNGATPAMAAFPEG